MRGSVIIVSILGIIAIIGYVYIRGYEIDRDVDSWMGRAQVAADREDMHEYMVTLQKNMKAYGLTSGHLALIFTNPQNDMSLQYQSVTRIIERLEGLRNVSKAETAYQVALDDIRGTIRELPRVTQGWLWVRFWWLSIPALLLCIAGACAVMTEN